MMTKKLSRLYLVNISLTNRTRLCDIDIFNCYSYNLISPRFGITNICDIKLNIFTESLNLNFNSNCYQIVQVVVSG